MHNKTNKIIFFFIKKKEVLRWSPQKIKNNCSNYFIYKKNKRVRTKFKNIKYKKIKIKKEKRKE